MSHYTAPSEPLASQRRGKIARLPAGIRHQLNLRLDDGHDAGQLLPWLNNLPEVRQIIENRFDNVPISPQNLSAWRQGGFQEWLIHRQLFDTAAHVHEQLEEFQGIFNCVNNDQVALKLADYMITQMTIRFTAFLAQWPGGAPDTQTKTMLKIGQFIIKLQQSAYRAQRQAAELPAIRYRVQHEVQTDLRHEIYTEMIREKAQAVRDAEAQRKEKPKKTPPQNIPATTSVQDTPASPKPPANPVESSPIKVNQASRDNPPSIASLPSLPSLPSSQPKTAPPTPTTLGEQTPH